VSKIIVLYDSKSGVTEKLAHAVAEGARNVEGVEVELLRVGKRFNLSKLDEAEAIVFGSPNFYNNVTSELEAVMDSLKEFKDQYRLEGKLGGVFESYGWLGGFATKKLRAYVDSLGMKFVEPAVSVYGKMPEDQAEPVHVYDEDLRKCRDLGKTIASQVQARQPRTREQEMQALRGQVAILQEQLEKILKKLEAIEGKST
jgi:flavorubredoxin